MNLIFFLFDVRPDPVGPLGIGIAAVVLLMIIGFVILGAAALVIFLWFRKRKMRTVEMIRTDVAASAAQPNNPNQR